jgi:O-antigen/teichoic acid export membrane protein
MRPASADRHGPSRRVTIAKVIIDLSRAGKQLLADLGGIPPRRHRTAVRTDGQAVMANAAQRADPAARGGAVRDTLAGQDCRVTLKLTSGNRANARYELLRQCPGRSAGGAGQSDECSGYAPPRLSGTLTRAGRSLVPRPATPSSSARDRARCESSEALQATLLRERERPATPSSRTVSRELSRSTRLCRLGTLTAHRSAARSREKERGLSAYEGGGSGRQFDSTEDSGSESARGEHSHTHRRGTSRIALTGPPNHPVREVPGYPAAGNRNESGPFPMRRNEHREAHSWQEAAMPSPGPDFTSSSSSRTRYRNSTQGEERSIFVGTSPYLAASEAGNPYPAESEASKRYQQEAGIAALLSLAVSIPATPITVGPFDGADSSRIDRTAPLGEASLTSKQRRRRWNLLTTDHLLRNSLYLILGSALQAALGSAFWIIAAQTFTAPDVGRASSLISATGFIASLAILGLNSAVDRYLPTAPNKNRLITAVLLLVWIAGAGAALIYLFLIPVIAPRLAFVAQSPLLAIGFILLTASAAVNLLTDSVFITSRKASYTALTDGGIAGVTKLVSAVVLAGTGAYGLYSASMSGFAVAAVASLVLIVKALRWRPSTNELFRTLKPFLRFSSANYVSGVFYLLPGLVVPLIVLDRLGPAEAAYYFIAFQVASLLYAFAYSVGQTFMAEGSQADAALRKLIMRSFAVLMAFVLPATLVLVLTAHWVLLAFGSKYSQHGPLCLTLLVVASIPLAVNHWLGTVLRLFHQLRAIIINGIVYAVAICGSAWFLAPYGLNALSSAWAIGGAVTAALAAVHCRESIGRQLESGRGRHRRKGR